MQCSAQRGMMERTLSKYGLSLRNLNWETGQESATWWEEKKNTSREQQQKCIFYIFFSELFTSKLQIP